MQMALVDEVVRVSTRSAMVAARDAALSHGLLVCPMPCCPSHLAGLGRHAHGQLPYMTADIVGVCGNAAQRWSWHALHVVRCTLLALKRR